MIVILDVENTVTKRDGKKHFDPFEPTNSLVEVGVLPLDGEPRTFVFDHVEHKSTGAEHSQVQAMLDECTLLVGHNLNHDLLWLWESGFTYEGEIFDTMLGEYVLLKGMKEPLSLDACAERHGLEFQKQDTLKEYLKKGVAVNEIPLAELDEYLRYDLLTTRDLYNNIKHRLLLEENESLEPIVDLTMRTCLTLARIYRNGIKVDMGQLSYVRQEFMEEKQQIECELQDHVHKLMGDTPINLNSPEQLSWVVFSRKPKSKTEWANYFNPYMKDTEFKAGVKAMSDIVYKTKAIKCGKCHGSGKYYKLKKDGSKFKSPNKCPECNATGFKYRPTKEVAGLKFSAPNAKWHSANGFGCGKDNLTYMEKVATSKGLTEAAEFLSKLRRLSALDSYLSSFVEGIASFVKPDGLLHVRLTQHITSTGRFSGRDPNMQNMPRGGTFPVKRVFVSRWEGGKMMEADFAQLEFRVAGFLSQDETIIDEVTNGFDVHSYTAKVITEAGEPTSRQDAKMHTFAPLYGATGFGRTPAQAAYYNQFTTKYKGVARWHKNLASEALTHRRITTPSGRQFSFPDVRRKPDGTVTHYTAIKNYPVQSFATADIVPACLMAIEDALKGKKSLLVNSVHDSVVIDIHPDEVEDVIQIIRDVNTNLNDVVSTTFGIDLNVPLLLEAKLGNNWLDQTDVT